MELLSLIIVASLVAVIAAWLFAPCPPRLPPGATTSSWLDLFHWGKKPSNNDGPLHLWLQRLARRHGPVVTVQAGKRPMVVVCRQSVLEELLLQTDMFQPACWLKWLSHKSQAPESMVPSDVACHSQDVSNFLSHGITSEALEDCVMSTLDVIIAEIRSLYSTPFDPEPLMTRLVFDILFCLFFGRKLPTDEFQQFMRAHDELNAAIDMALDQQLADSGKIPQAAIKRMDALNSQLSRMMEKDVRRLYNRRDSRKKKGVVGDLLDNRRANQQKDAATQRSKLGADLMALIPCLLDIFREWLDVCRNTLCWTLLYLTYLPQVHQQCQKEIDVNLEGHSPGMADEDLLVYIQAVLLEVLRLRPCRSLVTPLIAACPATLGGYDIQEGTLTAVDQWSLYHDPNTWPDPEQFAPARHLRLTRQHVIDQPSSRATTVTATAESGAHDDLLKMKLLLMISSLLHNFNISLPLSKLAHTKAASSSRQADNISAPAGHESGMSGHKANHQTFASGHQANSPTNNPKTNLSTPHHTVYHMVLGSKTNPFLFNHPSNSTTSGSLEPKTFTHAASHKVIPSASIHRALPSAVNTRTMCDQDFPDEQPRQDSATYTRTCHNLPVTHSYHSVPSSNPVLFRVASREIDPIEFSNTARVGHISSASPSKLNRKSFFNSSVLDQRKPQHGLGLPRSTSAPGFIISKAPFSEERPSSGQASTELVTPAHIQPENCGTPAVRQDHVQIPQHRPECNSRFVEIRQPYDHHKSPVSGHQTQPSAADVHGISQLDGVRGTLWLRPPSFKVVMEPKPRERRHVSDWRSVTLHCNKAEASHLLGVSSYAHVDSDVSSPSELALRAPDRSYSRAIRPNALTQPTPIWLSLNNNYNNNSNNNNAKYSDNPSQRVGPTSAIPSLSVGIAQPASRACDPRVTDTLLTRSQDDSDDTTASDTPTDFEMGELTK